MVSPGYTDTDRYILYPKGKEALIQQVPLQRLGGKVMK